MYTVKVENWEYKISPDKLKPVSGEIDETPYELDLNENGASLNLIYENKSYSIYVISADPIAKTFVIRVNGNDYELSAMDEYDILLKKLGMDKLASSALNDLKAPMPGLVLSVNVNAGDTVEKGDSILVLEAMKMENILKAPDTAVVKSIKAEIGKAVEKNEVLVEFE